MFSLVPHSNPMMNYKVAVIFLYNMINRVQPELELYSDAVSSLILLHHYSKVVLQVPKEMLPLAFNISSLLTRQHPGAQIFVLYDSLKQSCCTDVLGAEHVGYDCLVHFGKACFSQQHCPNHHYIFPQPKQKQLEIIRAGLLSQKNIQTMRKEGVGYVLVDQKYYDSLKKEIFQGFFLKDTGIQLLRLPMDATQGDEYLVFGFHAKFEGQIPKNILVVSDPEDSDSMSLVQQLSFTLKSLKGKVGQQILGLNLQTGEVEGLNPNNNKLLMQRYSLMTQLQDQDVFGIIVSNTATVFHKQTLRRCRQLLKRHHKKVYTFMMNNLNEVKLGNFPEIQVYVIISCYQHSLFGIKDFHRLVITPNDLETAFEARPFDEYAFDCASLISRVHVAQKEFFIKGVQNEASTELAKAGASQLSLREKIQSLDFYREREFKGLQFSEKKEVKKMSKGKIGLAQEYRNIE